MTNATTEIRLWLDDEREAPAGWTRVRTAREAISALEAGNAVEISLGGTGYDVMSWPEEAIATRGFVPPEILIHSANVVGRERMQRAIDNVEKTYWATNEDLQEQLQRTRESGREKIPHEVAKRRLGVR
jgi:hypothetical protein